MIKYALTCPHDHAFSAWFRDSAAYDDQVRRGLVTCPDCGSGDVHKAIMAPAVGRSRDRAEPVAKAAERSEFAGAEMMAAFRRFVEEHGENVGTKLPEEARKIASGEAEDRGIYGQATGAEVRALHEEGITLIPLPPAPEDLN